MPKRPPPDYSYWKLLPPNLRLLIVLNVFWFRLPVYLLNQNILILLFVITDSLLTYELAYLNPSIIHFGAAQGNFICILKHLKI